jgi:hypothetical protein
MWWIVADKWRHDMERKLYILEVTTKAMSIQLEDLTGSIEPLSPRPTSDSNGEGVKRASF